MSYPPNIRESLEKVEASRQQRLSQTYPRLTPQERETILHTFHPDFITSAFRELRLGVNRGCRAPRAGRCPGSRSHDPPQSRAGEHALRCSL